MRIPGAVVERALREQRERWEVLWIAGDQSSWQAGY